MYVSLRAATDYYWQLRVFYVSNVLFPALQTLGYAARTYTLIWFHARILTVTACFYIPRAKQ